MKYRHPGKKSHRGEGNVKTEAENGEMWPSVKEAWGGCHQKGIEAKKHYFLKPPNGVLLC